MIAHSARKKGNDDNTAVRSRSLGVQAVYRMTLTRVWSLISRQVSYEY